MQHLKNDDSVCILTAQSKAYNNLDRLQGKYSRGTILNENKANPVWFYFFFNILKIRGIGGCGHKVWQQRVLKIWNRYILMVAAVTWSYNVIKLHRTHTHTHTHTWMHIWWPLNKLCWLLGYQIPYFGIAQQLCKMSISGETGWKILDSFLYIYL
jgi:hypothetical protein